MDTTAPEITFDEKGVCSFCKQAQKSLGEIKAEKPNFPQRILNIKKDGGKQYDCLIGLSGGVDSSLALHYLVKSRLRPLCFSIDNGFNNPKADENIMNLVETLKVPFIRFTIDLDKFRDLQSAFLRAGQKNIEIPTDHILMASSYELAERYGIKWIVSGGNVATESIMPESWGYQARDLVHIKDVYKQMTGKSNLDGIPTCSLLKYNYYQWVKKIKTFYILDYFDYVRDNAKKLLTDLYKWQDYGDKHEESEFTKWFQNYYLYQKFGIDKRKAHYSSLINSGQMTRKEALELMKKTPVYPMFGIEARVMKYPKQPYTNFKTDEKLYKFISKIVRLLRKWKF